MSTAIWPCYFIWSGEAMIPTDRFKARCADQYEIGQTYRLAHEEEVSTESRGHYFATLKDMFDSLPENLASRFPDVDSLRYWSLIRCGYAEENIIACRSEGDAKQTVSFLAKLHPHAVFVIKGDVIQIFRARSQSTKSMGKELFQRSKSDVLDLIAHMIGVKLEDLAKPPKGRPEPPLEVEEEAVMEQASGKPQDRPEPKTPAPVPPKLANEPRPPPRASKPPFNRIAPSRNWRDFPPRDSSDYRTYAADWAMATRSGSDIMARWENEAALRSSICMTAEEVEACQAIIDRRLGQL